LRRRAEAIARLEQAPAADVAEMSDALQHTLYELRVHQIQLEMQNEELREAKLNLDIERERYFDLYNLAPVGYCTVSVQGLILEVNLTATTLLGAARSALVSKPFSRFILSSDRSRYQASCRQLLETRQAQSCELQTAPRPDRPSFWVKLMSTLISASDAPVMRIVLSNIDERKHTEQALHDSERRFRQLFERNTSVMLLVDPDTGRIIDANATAAAYYGYPAGRLMGMSINDINTLSPQRIAEEMQMALHEQRNYFLFQHRLASGEVRDVEVHSTPISVAGHPELMSIVHDISTRVRLASELDDVMQEQAAILNSGIVGIVKLTDRQILWSNMAFADMLGYSGQELTGQATRICYPSDQDYAAFAQAAYPVIESGQVFRGEVQFQRKDASLLWVRISGSLLRPQTTETIWSMVDITQGKLADAARQTTLDLMHNIASRVPGVVYQYLLRADGSSCFPFASAAIRDIYGVSPDEVREDASKVFAALHPDDFDAVVASIQASARDLTPWVHEYRVRFADGTVNWLLGRATPQRQSDGAVLWHGFITNINDRVRIETDLRQTAQELRTSERQMVIAQRISGTGSWTYDLASDEIWGSAEALHIFGYPAVARQFPIAEIEACIPERERVHQALLDLINQGREYDIEYSINPADGSAARIVHSVATLETDEQASARTVLGFVQDISKARMMEERVRQLAFLDPLTALPNRRLLLDRMGQVLAANQRSEEFGALVYMDLDNFKPLNDQHGHGAGDMLLMEVAVRLNSCVRAVDTVSRIGGDEFVVLLGGLSKDQVQSTEQASKLAEKIRVALAQPYLLPGASASETLEHHCSASIGVVLFDKQHQNMEDLLKWADAAMYISKEEGRNRVTFMVERRQQPRDSTGKESLDPGSGPG